MGMVYFVLGRVYFVFGRCILYWGVVSAHENIQIPPGFAARSLASRRRFISFLGFTTKPKSEFAEPLSLELAAQSQSPEPELGA